MQQDSPLIFPRQADKGRLDKYNHYDKLYFGDHYEAFSIVGEANFNSQYGKLRYISANFGGLMSRVMADMLFGETITVDVNDKNTQSFLDGLMEQNQLLAQLYESALGNSRRGDSCFKVRIGRRNPADTDPTIIIEEFSPAIYFPALDATTTRNTPKQDVIAVQFQENGKTYLKKEIHTPGFIEYEIYNYDPKEGKIVSQENVADFGLVEREETRVPRSLVFHIPNVRDGSGFWGTSDYKDLDSLFFALNNRITKVDNILDKHSDPILAVPPGVLDEDGKVNKASIGMFEVTNETAGFNKPEYITWNANLDSAFKQIDHLVKMLFLFSEIAPASTGSDDGGGGQAESGRALKFKLISTLRKRSRKMRYYDQALKDMLETAQDLATAHGISINDLKPAKTERPTIKWGDGVVNDTVEAVEIATKRIDAGLSSRADEIAHLDGVTPDEAKKKVAEIDKENEPAVLPAVSNNLDGNGTGKPNPPEPPASTGGQVPGTNKPGDPAART